MKVRLSGKARSDLVRIYRYLADRNPAAADELAAEIDLKLNQLSHFPFIGRTRSELAPNLRSMTVRTFLLFYRVRDEQIEIVRVIDGCMDIQKELQR